MLPVAGRLRHRGVLALAYALLVVSCDDPIGPSGDVTRIEVNPPSLTMTAGESRTVTVRAFNGDGGQIDRRVFWSTQNPAVATVTQAGVVTAVAAGNTQIAVSAGGKSAVIPVTVNLRPVSLVRVSPQTAQVQAGATRQLTAEALDATSTPIPGKQFFWTSSSAAATVSSTGLVTGVSQGTATITATADGVQGTSTVTIIPVPVASVTVSPSTQTIIVGQTLQLAATTADSSGSALTGRIVTWSSNSAAASVSSTGMVTAIAQGTAIITATSEGKSGTATIQVSAVPVATVTVSPPTSTVSVGGTVQLSVRLQDANGTELVGRQVSWSSEQPAIATVSDNGLVTTLSPGSARITATSEGRSNTATVNVTQVAIDRIDVTPVTASLLVGGTQQLTATPRDALGNPLAGRQITWISGATSVATVNSEGLVTAVSPGTALVFAASEGRSGSATIMVSTVAVSTVTITPGGQPLQQGQSLQLTATPRDAAGNIISGRPVTWTSNSEAIATVSSTGRLTGITPGPVTITARVDGVAGTANYTITQVPVGSVVVSPGGVTLAIGQTQPMTASLFDGPNGTGNPLSTAGRVITWSSSAAGVASVNASTGLVTAVSAGTATITATSEGKTSFATITVSQTPVSSVTVAPGNVALNAGSNQVVTVTAFDNTNTPLPGRNVTLSSSNTAIATVSPASAVTNGAGQVTATITAVAAGSATISAVVGGITGFATVSVSQVPIATITVTPNPASVEEGGTLTLTATARDAGGTVLTGRTIVWASNNPSVSVSQTGVVTAVFNSASQSATITASSPGGGAGGSTPSGTATVNVTFAPVGTVVVTPSPGTVLVGNTTNFAAALQATGGQSLNAAGRTVSWTSLDPTKATVNATGGVTGVAPTTVGSPVGIVASATSPGQTGTPPADTTFVTVTNVAVDNVVVSPVSGPNPGSVHVGAAYARKYIATAFAGGTPQTGRPVTWSITNQNINASLSTLADTVVVTGLATTGSPLQLTANVEGVLGNLAVPIDLVPVANVVVTPASATLNPSGPATVQLAASPRDSAGNVISGSASGGRSPTWTSDNTAAATVNSSGLVTAVAAGSANISAPFSGSPSQSSAITVLAPVQSIVFAAGTDSVIAPGTVVRTLTVFSGAGGTGTPLSGRSVTIASSNPAFATVAPTAATSDASGNVMVTLTGVAAGTVTIDATSEGVNQASPAIRVLNPVASVTVSIAPADSIIGSGSATATATLRDAGNNVLTGRPITWSSSVTGTATIDAAGVITTAATPGQTTITATSETVSGNRTFKYLAPANTISLTSPGDSVLGTGSLAISATVRDALNNVLTGRAITWTSRTPAAATVNTSGLVTGVAPGSSWIVAAVEGKLDSLLMRILPGINAIALTPATDSIIGTGSLPLTATATDGGSAAVQGRPLSISSANSAVATVSPSSGVTNASGQVALTVTGVAPGTSLLTVAAEGKTATRTIRILAPVATVSLAAPGDSIIGTATLQVSATLRDASNNVLTGRPTTWLSSNTGVATVSATGLVTGVSSGTTNITATSETVTSAAYVVRVLPPVASVTVSAPDSSIFVGDTLTATAVARDAGMNILPGRPVAWTSSVPAKATIGASTGAITALDSGSTTITGTVEGQSANFVLTVSLVPAVTVTVTPASPNDSTGRQITFTGTPRDAANNPLTGRAISWSSSNTARLTIDPSTGVATMVDSGTVDVIATTTPGTGMGGTATGQTTVTIVLTPINTVTAPSAHNSGAGSYNATAVDTRGGPAGNRACIMSSSDTNFVTVPPSGTTNAGGILTVAVTGVAVGSATVTVTCEGKTAQTVVTVP